MTVKTLTPAAEWDRRLEIAAQRVLAVSEPLASLRSRFGRTACGAHKSFCAWQCDGDAASALRYLDDLGRYWALRDVPEAAKWVRPSDVVVDFGSGPCASTVGWRLATLGAERLVAVEAIEPWRAVGEIFAEGLDIEVVPLLPTIYDAQTATLLLSHVLNTQPGELIFSELLKALPSVERLTVVEISLDEGPGAWASDKGRSQLDWALEAAGFRFKDTLARTPGPRAPRHRRVIESFER